MARGRLCWRRGQRLTLVHCSAQPKPLWSVIRFVSDLRRVITRISTEGTTRIPERVHTLGSVVDECKPRMSTEGTQRIPRIPQQVLG